MLGLVEFGRQTAALSHGIIRQLIKKRFVMTQAVRPLLVLIALSLLCWLLPEEAQRWLVYSRAEPLQLWRFVTGHLLHSNVWHLAMNLGGLLVIFYLHQMHYQSRQFVQFCLLAAALISCALFLFSPQIQTYVGLSGLLHALLAFGAVRDVQQRWYSGALILLGLTGKVLYEQWQGPDPALGALIGARVAIDAHGYGLLIGLLLALTLPNYGLSSAGEKSASA